MKYWFLEKGWVIWVSGLIQWN